MNKRKEIADPPCIIVVAPEDFLKQPFGMELKNCAQTLNTLLNRNDDSEQLLHCEAQWEIFHLAMLHFYGVEISLERTDEYYGIRAKTATETVWLFKAQQE